MKKFELSEKFDDLQRKINRSTVVLKVTNQKRVANLTYEEGNIYFNENYVQKTEV